MRFQRWPIERPYDMGSCIHHEEEHGGMTKPIYLAAYLKARPTLLSDPFETRERWKEGLGDRGKNTCQDKRDVRRRLVETHIGVRSDTGEDTDT